MPERLAGDPMDAISGKVDELGRRMDERFEQVDKRFERIEVDLHEQRSELAKMQRTMLHAAIGMSVTYTAGFSALIGFIATQL